MILQESQIIQFAVGVITLSHMIKQIIQFRQQVSFGYTFSTEKQYHKKIHVKIRCPNTVTIMISLVKTWWIINHFENDRIRRDQ